MKMLLQLTASTIMAALASSVQAGTWHMAADFNINNGNPNGAWSYGRFAAGLSEFVPHPLSFNAGGPNPGWAGSPDVGGQPHMWHNLTGGVYYGIPDGWISVHPGTEGQASCVRWTAPPGVQGAHQVTGAFLPGDSGVPTVTVRHNGVQVWSGVDAGSFDLALQILPGDTIDFEAHGIYYYGNTAVGATIQSPCPADLNGDGEVSGADLGMLLGNWGLSGAPGDLDGDGSVSGADLGMLLGSWGSCTG